MSAEQTPDIAGGPSNLELVIAGIWGEHSNCTWVSTGVNVMWSCGIWHPGPIHMQPTTRDRHVAALVMTQVNVDLAAAVREARAEAWDEAAELADTQIVLWSGVPGLHPEAQEPHPAAIAAAGARRTLVVLRSRMTEAFRDRADRITEPVSHEAATSGEEASKA